MTESQKEYTQRTDEWYAARKGKITASEIEKIMHDRKEAMTPEELAEWKAQNPKSRVTTKTVPFNDGSFTYLNKKVMERLMSDEQFKTYTDETYAGSRATEWGQMMEAFAKEEYEKRMHVKVSFADFITHPYQDLKDFVGASPDGLIPSDMGSIEIKCPYTLEKHLLHLSYESIEQFKEEEPVYYWQIRLQQMVTDSAYTDFVSYCPWMQGEQQLKVLRVPRDENEDALLMSRLYLAKEYIEEKVAYIKSIPTIII